MKQMMAIHSEKVDIVNNTEKKVTQLNITYF